MKDISISFLARSDADDESSYYLLGEGTKFGIKIEKFLFGFS